MSELITANYSDSDKEPNTFASESTTTIKDSEDLDLSACSSFASCRSILNCKHHTSDVSLDSGIVTESLMGSNHKLLPPGLEKEDHDEIETLIKGSSTRVVMKRKSLQPADSSEPIDEIDVEEVCQRFKRWFRPTEIREAFRAFSEFDEDADGFIELGQLKRLLEKLSMPQTHLAAKEMMANTVGDYEQMTFCQFLLAYANLLERATFNKSFILNCQTERLAKIPEVDVAQVGVSGAKLFFEAKIAMQLEKGKAPPVAKIIVKQAQMKNAAEREMFKSAASVFRQLDKN